MHPRPPFRELDVTNELVSTNNPYRVVGPSAKSKQAQFQTALLFAQEYGILAASMEDRPFVPGGIVVMGRAPRDLKCVFRKWDGGREGRERERERVVSLSEALEALRG